MAAIPFATECGMKLTKTKRQSMRKPKIVTDGIVVQKSSEETLLYDLMENKAYCLNQTSALVWELCDGNRSVSEISDAFSARFNTTVSKDLVYLVLDQLDNNGLLEEKFETPFAGLSRREMIRKVGFAAVVALPTISSLVAPSAAAAQSCLDSLFPVSLTLPNLTTQPDLAARQAYCGLDPNNNPDSRCCSGVAESTLVAFFPPAGTCSCIGYRCAAN